MAHKAKFKKNQLAVITSNWGPADKGTVVKIVKYQPDDDNAEEYLVYISKAEELSKTTRYVDEEDLAIPTLLQKKKNWK